MAGNEIAVGYVSIIPVARGIQGAMAKELSGVQGVANVAGKRSGNAFAQAFNQFGGKKLAAALTVGGLAAFGKKSVDAFKEIAAGSLAVQRTMGGTIKQASEWRGAMQLGGVTTQQFNMAIKTMSKQTVTAKSAFKTMGISVKDAHGNIKPLGDLLPIVADRFAQMAPGAQKNALAVQLFGRSGLQMLPFLNRGAAGLEALKKQAEKAGIVIGDDGVNAFKKNLAASRLLHAQWQGLQIFIGQRLIPIVTTFVGWMGKLVTFFNQNRWAMGMVAGLLAGVVAFKLISSATRGWGAALNAIKANPVIAIISGLVLLGIWLVHTYRTSETFRNIVNGVLEALKHAWDNVWHAAENVKHAWDNVWHAGENLMHAWVNFMHALDNVRHAWDNLWHAGQNVVNFFQVMPGKITAFFSGAYQWLLNAGSNVIKGLQAGISWAWNNVLYPWLWGIPKRVLLAIGNAELWLLDAGRKIITGMWNGVKEVWNSVANWFKDLPGHILDLLGIHSPPKWAISAGKWIMKGMLHGLLHGSTAIGTFVKSMALSIASGFMPSQYSNGQMVGNANAFYDYAKAQMAVWGWNPSSEFPALYSLWQGESGWNPLAKNPSSGAYGIPQSLPADKMASAGPNWLTDAATQIRWGLKYIHDAYGSPSNAYAQWLARRPHWYKEGAWEVPQNQLAFLHKKEMVVPTDQAERFRRGAGGPSIQQNFYGSTSAADKRNVDAAAREMAWAYRTLT